jgi:DNA-binding GntR family transcriptional regulator
VSSASIPSVKEKPDEATVEKMAQIMTACAGRDLAALIELATSDLGLVDDTLRRSACMSPSSPWFAAQLT